MNHRDIIVWLPGVLKFLVGSYRHVQERKYINAQGKCSGNPSLGEWPALLRVLLTGGRVARRLKAAPGDIRAGLPLPGAVVDHTPRRYAAGIWNAYIDT